MLRNHFDIFYMVQNLLLQLKARRAKSVLFSLHFYLESSDYISATLESGVLLPFETSYRPQWISRIREDRVTK